MPDLSPAALEDMSVDELRALQVLLRAVIAMRSLLGDGALDIELIEDEGFSLVVTVKETPPCAPSA